MRGDNPVRSSREAPSIKARLGTLPFQVVFLIVLPVTLGLLVVAFGGAAIHTEAMRGMVAMRDERTVRAAAAWLETQWDQDVSPADLVVLTGDLIADEPSHQFTVFLVNRDGRVLVHPDSSLAGMDLHNHPGVSAALGGETGSLFLRHSEDNNEVVIAYSPIGETGWGLLLEESWSAIADPQLRYSQIAPLALVPALLLAAGALVFGIRRIVQPLQQLGHQADRVGWGEFDALSEPVGGIEEIQALQTTLAHMAEQLQAAQAGMRSYAAALTRGQEEERARLARELHDETVQILIALEHRIHMLRRAISRDPDSAISKADELAKMAAGAVKDVRRVIRALRPLYLEDLGWIPAIQSLVNDLEKSGELTAAFRITGNERRLEPVAELALFRITQETLSNVVRHSRARQTSVEVAFSDDAVRLSIHDDGQGFSPPARVEELASAGHFGLMGMQERAQLVGARLRIESSPGQGTTLEIALPIAAS